MSRSPCRPTGGSTTVAVLLLAVVAVIAEPSQAVANPIGRVARAFNERLVEVESQIDMLSKNSLSLAEFQPSSLQSGFGFRGGRAAGEPDDPWVIIDLGKTTRIDQVYLVPAQKEATHLDNFFPRRFVVEISDDPSFTISAVVYRQNFAARRDDSPHPLYVNAGGQEARYLRLLVFEGTPSGNTELFALSEILTLSGSEPVSIGAKTTCSWQLKVPELWEERFLTDGRMPLGLWHGGTSSPNRGLQIPVNPASRDAPFDVIIDLGQEHPVDRIHLLPLECPNLPGLGILPESFVVSLGLTDRPAEMTPVFRHENRSTLPRTELCPLTIVPGQPARARFLHLRATRPWQYGDMSCHGLAEIQVFSGGANVALGASVRIEQDGTPLAVTGNALVDGFSSKRKVLPVRSWLSQLVERNRIESELAHLVPLSESLSDDSELHASWTLATLVGISFLIPVAIIERRRLVSKEQLDILRKRIASDLHDDIGSNLGSISMIARSAKRDLQLREGPPELAADLEDVEAIARESSLALRDIVWLIERRADTVGDLVKRLRDTASRLMRDHDCRIECSGSITSARLSLDAKRHLFLFCKEAMHNVVKHAKATTCEMLISDVRESMVVEVKDDGVGLDIKQLRHRTIFHKLEERARVLGGTLQVESAKGEGTTLRLRVARSGLLSKIPL